MLRVVGVCVWVVIGLLFPVCECAPLRGPPNPDATQSLAQACPPLSSLEDKGFPDVGPLPVELVAPSPVPKPIVPKKEWIPAPPKIGQEAGHPTKEEMDTLDALFRFSFESGFQDGWKRAQAEKTKKMLGESDSSDTGDTSSSDNSDTDVVAQALSNTAKSTSVEDGGSMSKQQAVQTAMAALGTSLDNPKQESVPEAPDDPYMKEDSNDLHPNEHDNGFTQSSSSGRVYSPSDKIRKPDNVPKTSDKLYMSPQQIINFANGGYRSNYDVDRSYLCDLDPTYCKPTHGSAELVLNADGYWEPGLVRDDGDGSL